MATDARALLGLSEKQGCSLTIGDAERLLAYLDAILEANQQLNLTGIRDREQAVILHILDSLAASALPLSPKRCLDLGSGNGFPGVALATLWPRSRLVLMDRTGKKIRAIQQCLQSSGFTRCTALHMDAAMVPSLQPDLIFDLVAARAVTVPRELAPIAAPLTARGGHLLLWQNPSPPEPQLPGNFTLQQTLPYQLPHPAERTMQLALYVKR